VTRGVDDLLADLAEAVDAAASPVVPVHLGGSGNERTVRHRIGACVIVAPRECSVREAQVLLKVTANGMHGLNTLGVSW
jgi:hypothetical protein